jgi:predicted phage terminase large subunit-like protein
MQRLHPEDLVGHLTEQDGWTVLNLPAIAEIDEDIPLGGNRVHHRTVGSVLHPEREPLAVLNELKQMMGSLDFSAQYQQQLIPVGGNLVKWSWFRFYDEPPVPLPTDRIIVSWDTAMNSNELADYSACVVLLLRGETVYVLDVYRARLDYPNLKRKVIEIHRRWRHSTLIYALIVENKGSGMSLIQDLRDDGIHAIGILPEGDKIMRMSAQTARIEAGSVLLPKQASWLDEFRRELLAFPASRHSDQVDALSQALKRAFAPPPPAAVQSYYSRTRVRTA